MVDTIIVCAIIIRRLTKVFEQMSIHPDLTTLESLLKTHDWYYQYSDDHRVWTKGRERADEIQRQLSICCGLGLDAIAQELYNKYQQG